MSEYTPNSLNLSTIEVHSIGYCTSMGFNNCFDLEDDKGNSFRIVNFYLENFELLLKNNTISYPVTIHILNSIRKIAVLLDPRIPLKFYNDKFCKVCCPKELLPMPQLIEETLLMRKGIVTYEKLEDGTVIYRSKFPIPKEV